MRAQTPKQPKYDFEKMKSGATSSDPKKRKQAFIEYFERFQEFPSYLFDNSSTIHELLFVTIRDIKNDPTTSEKMQAGIATLLERLPAPATAL